MAYTYEDFLTKANEAGVMAKLSKKDLDTASRSPEFGISLVGLLQDAGGADTAEKQLLATEAANQLRKNYGIYNDGDSYAASYGSQINNTMGQLQNYGSFTYDQQDAYKELLNGLAQQEPFSYDASKDPSWSAMRKQYLREGGRATADTLAKASAATGGQPSSYAVTASQQMGNYYAAQLSDRLPELEQQAYQRYLGDISARQSALDALSADRDFAYNGWMDQYNILQNGLQNLQTQDETDYQRYLNQLSMGLTGSGGSNGSSGGTEMAVADAAYNTAVNAYLQQINGNAAGIAGAVGAQPVNGAETQQASPVTGTDLGYPADEGSLLSLGIQNLTAEMIDAMVKSGELIEYLENGVYKYKWANKTGGSAASRQTGAIGGPDFTKALSR